MSNRRRQRPQGTRREARNRGRRGRPEPPRRMGTGSRMMQRGMEVVRPLIDWLERHLLEVIPLSLFLLSLAVVSWLVLR